MFHSYELSTAAARARILAWATAYAAQPLTAAGAARLLAMPGSVQKLVYALAAGDRIAAAGALDALTP
jgi:ABC-type hemin transport system substrate-binding protein